MSKNLNKPICRFISAGVASSAEYRSLNVERPSRLLFFCLLIHPHGGSFHVPGLYKVGPEALRETSGLPRRAFLRSFSELHEKNIVQSDRAAQLLWMPAALNLMGPPANPNMVKGYCRSILQLPGCELLDVALTVYRQFLTNLGPSFLQPFMEAFGDRSAVVPSAAGEPFANGFARVGETYTNSNKDFHKDTQSNNNDEAETFAASDIGGMTWAANSEGLDWPQLSDASCKAYLEELPPLSKGDVLKARAEAFSRPKIRDPWAYFFAVLRRQALRRDGLQPVGAPSAEDGDPFAAYADGEVVTFDD